MFYDCRCALYFGEFLFPFRDSQSSFFNCTTMTMSREISEPDWVIIHPVRFGGSLSLLLTLKMDNNCHCQGFLFPILLNFSQWTVFFAILIICYLVLSSKQKHYMLLISSTNYFTAWVERSSSERKLKSSSRCCGVCSRQKKWENLDRRSVINFTVETNNVREVLKVNSTQKRVKKINYD